MIIFITNESTDHFFDQLINFQPRKCLTNSEKCSIFQGDVFKLNNKHKETNNLDCFFLQSIYTNYKTISD